MFDHDLGVTMPDGTHYQVQTLLTHGNANHKMAKSSAAGRGYLTYGLSLAPSDTSGYNVCARASVGCRVACLFYAGHGTFPSVQRGRIAKTRLFFQNRPAFLATLHAELHRARRNAERRGQRLAVRLNVVSDLPWERIDPSIFTTFTDVQFYDYTKLEHRIVPSNYHLTFSRSEQNTVQAIREYRMGRNIAVVFSDPQLPKTWNGIRVLNGDDTDLRFLDRRGVIGLYAKGRGRADQSGFVVQTAHGKILRMAGTAC